jgi:hypothetical protein
MRMRFTSKKHSKFLFFITPKIQSAIDGDDSASAWLGISSFLPSGRIGGTATSVIGFPALLALAMRRLARSRAQEGVNRCVGGGSPLRENKSASIRKLRRMDAISVSGTSFDRASATRACTASLSRSVSSVRLASSNVSWRASRSARPIISKARSTSLAVRACLRRGFRRGGKRDSWGVGLEDDTRCDGTAEPTRPT